jgi:glycosyltransferase involved in cell wall biosynthesis
MIVKNEAHCIAKCLESVKPYIDYWIISDTGSSDNTEKIVKKALKGIPGEFHHHEWSDFSTNRNLSLELAKTKADYVLIIDADDYLTLSDPKVISDLDKDAYGIEIEHGSIRYARTQIVKSSLDCKYKSVLHEYMYLPEGTAAYILPGATIHFGANGARSQDPDKYLKDATVLEKALITEPDNSRYVFYCAQSYRDAKEPHKAISYYNKRINMGGWSEEIYVSFLEAAKLLETLIPTDMNSIESSYLRAYNYLPTRIESLHYLAVYCRNNKAFDKAYFYAKIAQNTPYPNGLFVEKEIYDWKMKDELAVAAFYVGAKEEAIKLNLEILEYPHLSVDSRSRVLKNLQFCKG